MAAYVWCRSQPITRENNSALSPSGCRAHTGRQTEGPAGTRPTGPVPSHFVDELGVDDFQSSTFTVWEMGVDTPLTLTAYDLPACVDQP